MGRLPSWHPPGRLSRASPQRASSAPHKDNGGAHLDHQLMRDGAARKICRIYVDLAAALFGGAADMAQYPQRRVNVPQLRHVHQLGTRRAYDGCRDDGKRRVLRALHKKHVPSSALLPRICHMSIKKSLHAVEKNTALLKSGYTMRMEGFVFTYSVLYLPAALRQGENNVAYPVRRARHGERAHRLAHLAELPFVAKKLPHGVQKRLRVKLPSRNTFAPPGLFKDTGVFLLMVVGDVRGRDDYDRLAHIRKLRQRGRPARQSMRSAAAITRGIS